MNFKQDYDIHDIPLWLKPSCHLLAMLLIAPLIIYRFVCQLTLRIQIEGEPTSLREPSVVYCYWHEAITCGLWLFDFRHIALLFHPKLYMLPFYYLFRSVGCRKFVYGSTGNQGRSAQDALISALQSGFASTLNPDGPAGPPKKAKPGAYHLSLQGNLAIVPLQITVSHRWRSWDWDRKFFPLPWAVVRVKVGPKLWAKNFPDKAAFLWELERQLG